jgi:hypothetical protein
MHRIGRIGMNECAGRDQRRAVGLGQVLGRGRGRKYKREKEKPECNAESGAENAAEEKDENAAKKSAHEFLPCRRR